MSAYQAASGSLRSTSLMRCWSQGLEAVSLPGSLQELPRQGLQPSASAFTAAAEACEEGTVLHG